MMLIGFVRLSTLHTKLFGLAPHSLDSVLPGLLVHTTTSVFLVRVRYRYTSTSH